MPGPRRLFEAPSKAVSRDVGRLGIGSASCFWLFCSVGDFYRALMCCHARTYQDKHSVAASLYDVDQEEREHVQQDFSKCIPVYLLSVLSAPTTMHTHALIVHERHLNPPSCRSSAAMTTHASQPQTRTLAAPTPDNNLPYHDGPRVASIYLRHWTAIPFVVHAIDGDNWGASLATRAADSLTTLLASIA